MKYKVGQIVYLLDNSEMKIFPARVEEEIVRRKIGSEEISYKILLPGKSHTIADLSDLDVVVFESASGVRDHMVSNAIKTIDRIVEKAETIARSMAVKEDAPSAPVRSGDQDDTI